MARNERIRMMDGHDYVIVGAGAAGCVVANRLSEHRAHSVLLIEAGPQKGPRATAIPAAWPSIYHPVGTCRMGSGPDAVVDNELRVRGVERLRVVDASIMPTIVAGHPQAATMMIAEKGADMILANPDNE